MDNKKFTKELASKLQKAETDLKNLSDSPEIKALAPKYAEVPVPGVDNCPNALIAHSITYNPTTAYLEYHIKNVSADIMKLAYDEGIRLSLTVLLPLPGNIIIDAGRSRETRNEWEFIVHNVPVLRSTEIHNHVLSCFINKMKGA